MLAFPTFAQQTDKLLRDLLNRSPELFGPVLRQPGKYDVQILYTQIHRNAQNRPTFKTYRYRVDKNRYFYPASTVKLPAVLLALEKLNQLRKPGLTRDTPMLTDSAYDQQTTVRRDTTSPDGLPSVAQYIKKILLASDNDAFNRLYEFIGQCAFNEQLQAKGYPDLRIVHRLSLPLTAEQNRRTNPIRFVQGSGNASDSVIYQQPMQVCDQTFGPTAPIRRGIGYMQNGTLVKEPFDFTDKNYFALEDQQEMLKAVLFPEEVKAEKRFALTPDDYRFLYQYLSQLPRETTYPAYDSTHHDGDTKFFLFGDGKSPMPKNIRIFNKIGAAYGYLIDNAYIVDFERGVEFMLSAVISCNPDGIYNDNRYEYSRVGYPFLANLGRVIYDYEVKRKRPRPSDLSQFRIKYDK